ncbi:hypothetical protein [uncultured Methylophaga sp.]|uniref:hypothetical protein n=1 Tax=uncultured Methylophaga sp. TaxID=285271 RepID=UPI002622061C|nr:hypothetical protein [uncultured Methylophaga sp.]
MSLSDRTKLEENDTYIEIARKYPHIGKKIDAFWGSEFFEPYIDSLFTETRDGQRKGFPMADVMALLSLRLLHESEFDIKRSRDVWDSSR